MPAPGEPGSETWPKGDQWKTGGGSVWVTGNYDPETNLAFWGTGNGGPWMGDQRPGDNLYTSSTIAIDVATGTIKGHFQYHPNDSWDWDEVSPPILVDYTRNGRTVKGLIDVARDGYLWFLERTDGPINFVEGTPFVKQNVFKSLDPKTGRPDVDPARKPGTGKEAEFCPSHLGRQELAADRVQPEDADDLHSGQRESLRRRSIGRPSHLHRRAARSPARPPRLLIAPGADHIGEVQAWNVDTGKRVWTHTYADVAELGADAGDRRRPGVQRRHATIGMFHAFDATSGKLLWEFPTNSGIIGQPSSFMVDGRQYVAVQSGLGHRRAGDAGAAERGCRPGDFPEVPEGGAIWVFAVK